ncbi:hypothetical protein ACFQDG_01170 [Natronoarchaeum mannanilyticum]|uniref:Halobacterial output domain-containing protein n=1 Tax=Natronoarchaeum mannanilyticum TaxID=926360 RepID=A0AAV3TD64_9EURY
MDDDTHRFMVKVQVQQRNHGALRSIEVLDEDSTAAFVDTQDWRLETLSVESHVRETLDLPQLDETTQVGYVDVHPDTLEWSFTPTNDSLVS